MAPSLDGQIPPVLVIKEMIWVGINRCSNVLDKVILCFPVLHCIRLNSSCNSYWTVSVSLVVFVLHRISRCIRLNWSCNSYCTVSLVFLFVCVVQRADDLAILSSIQILCRTGSNCMVVTTRHVMARRVRASLLCLVVVVAARDC